MSEFVVPLESNPDVLNKFMSKIGVSEKYQIVDVYGLDKDTLDFIPKPVKAFILLFPCTENYELHRKNEDTELTANPPPSKDNLFYMKQFLHNACGTIAIFHAILNNLDSIEVSEGPLKSFYEKAKALSAEERGKLLEQDKDIIEIHQNLAKEGQTAPPDSDEKVLFHYVAFTNIGGEIFELDGRKNFPINHGKTNEDSFLADAAAVCKKFMDRDQNELRFSIMAIAANGDQ